MTYIGKILPVDGYYTRIKDNLPVDYSKSLTHLYQPLIGIQATMLYYTLLHETEIQEGRGGQTHHTLMNYLNMPLDEIYKARLKLEGIGLLNTFEHQTEEKQVYLYELISPFSPGDFFQDAMLSELLFHHIDHTTYQQLKKHYETNTLKNNNKNITASFNDVFQTFPVSPSKVEPISNYQQDKGVNLVSIDFSWIEHSLKQRLIPVKKVLTRDNKRVIQQMMTLYNLTTYDIENALLWALTDENLLNISEFKDACHSMFQSKSNHTPVKLVEKQETTQPEQTTESAPRSQSKEEMLIHELETISPQQLLVDLSNGNQASAQDMKVIRDVMTSQGLPSPVMNVLIHYVLLQSNMKLSKAYMEKIAGHWSRAKLTTAREAMQFAKNEQKQFQQQKNKPKTTYQRYNKRRSNEVVPDWFKERNAVGANKHAKRAELDGQREKEELEMLLKQYRK